MRRFLKEVIPSSIKHIVRDLKMNEPSSNSSLELPTLTAEIIPEIVEKHKYEHEFAMFTCSFERDMYRCLNAYKSFLAFFEDAENIPYYICVPEKDLEDFRSLFSGNLNQGESEPIFWTERYLLELTDEPVESALALPGYYLQDVLRLCFGLTATARHYFMNDSDGYFIKSFNKSKCYVDGELGFCFHEVWHEPKSLEEMQKNVDIFGLGHGNEQFIELKLSYLDIQNMVKHLLRSDFEKYRNFTCTPCAFDSDVVQALLVNIRANGVGSFTNAMRIVPFAFQLYGEFLSKIGRLRPLPFLFFTIEPHVTQLKVPSSYFDDSLKYGIQYQSVDYSGGSGGVPHDRVKPEIIFISETNKEENEV